MKNMKEGFPPIRNEWAIVLILGSMLGEESLKKKNTTQIHVTLSGKL